MVQLTRLNMPCLETCTNYVEVKYDSMEAAGARFCCNAPSDTIYSQRNSAIVLHKTESNLPIGWQGWSLLYKYCTLIVISNQNITHHSDESPTTQTTTTRPITATWSAWSAWSSCTSTCGMCGR